MSLRCYHHLIAAVCLLVGSVAHAEPSERLASAAISERLASAAISERLASAAISERLASAAISTRRPTPAQPSALTASSVWFVTQLIPSPLLVIGDHHVGGGMRWQVTPLLYSFGIAASPVRAFYVSPIARHSGSLELHASPEWSCCAADGGSSWLLRAGLRAYLPLIEHGETLSLSFGAAYAADQRPFDRAEQGLSGDIGIYTLFGVLGLTVTVSPLLSRRQVIVALNIRYF